MAGVSVSALTSNNQIIIKNPGVISPAPLVREQMEPKTYLYAIASRSAEVCGYSKKPNCRQVNIAEQLDEIITRESQWGYYGTNPAVCNKEFGCGSGKGLIQLIEKTRKYCEEKLKKSIDAANPYDSLECGVYLLEKDPIGIGHWDSKNGLWGSGPY